MNLLYSIEKAIAALSVSWSYAIMETGLFGLPAGIGVNARLLFWKEKGEKNIKIS